MAKTEVWEASLSFWKINVNILEKKKTYIKTIKIPTLQPQELILYICS